MAGSAFRPLTNIPYCCLPQESGPCLSTSVGDRPLRSPSHRSLGGPSPRLPANGTHARPCPTPLCHGGDAPPADHAVLPAVSSGYPAGRGWLHTRYAPVRHSRDPEGPLPSDLHVLGLPLAFILSQDQTLRCTIVLCSFFRIPGPAFALMSFVEGFPLRPGGLTARPGPKSSCAGLKLSKNSPAMPPLPNAPFP